MNEVEYERMQEDAAMGQFIFENLRAILSDNGAGDTVADLARSTYKYTDAGVSLAVRLHDGSVRYCDNLHGIDNGNVRALGVSSIVEGSDAEVPMRWLDLMAPESAEDAVTLFNALVEDVNAEACALWDEANADESEDE
jgi:hypothetical protein